MLTVPIVNSAMMSSPHPSLGIPGQTLPLAFADSADRQC